MAMKDYESLQFEYRGSPDQRAAEPAFHPVVVVGAGPVGLSLAVDLAQRGLRVVLLDNDHKLSSGSRAICFAKRTLEIFDRLGCCEPMMAKGVSWNVGHVYFRDEEVYRFDLLPEPGHERPAFINLQQYYVEGFLVERALALPNLEIRWQNTVTGLVQDDDAATLAVDTPDGPYRLRAGFVAACDGSRSPLRGMLGVESKGRTFRDRFLIADVRIAGIDMPCERRFWFDPPFHPGQSVLLHKQADGVWRIDFQLGWDADPDAERRPERILPRVRAVLDSIGAAGRDVELVWASVYTFACLRMERFRHGRVLFAGDAAHGVSPFGARGANSGVQDAENLAWKLARVARGEAPDSLLDSYAHEREYAADENIRHSSRATDFITPKSEVSRLFRDAVLDLARDHAFARRIVNSGRLSTATHLPASPLSTPDGDTFDGGLPPGAPAADAPLSRGGTPTWLLRELGDDFTLLVFGPAPAWTQRLPLATVAIDGQRLADTEGWAARRYAAQPGTAVLVRPDRHVAARWRTPTEAAVRAALARACALA
jgi:3-(3-hydroxy-phenyl)propionate hydroxylase